MTVPIFVLSVIAGMLLAETRLSRRHESALRAGGAVEPPEDVYHAMAVAYPAAFVMMGIEGVVRASRGEAMTGGVLVSGALLFVVSKALKYWAIGALGPRWSFRVLVLPGVPLVATGPYRYVAHPNYVAILGELAGTAMMMKATVTGPIALLGFGALLWKRLRIETRALQAAYDTRGRSAAGPTTKV